MGFCEGMTLVLSTPNEKKVRAEIREMKKAGKEIRKSKESAHAFLLKYGFITKDNKLSPRYR